jgi:hypothetical protein
MAGLGKSAVAQSIAHNFALQHRLAGSFFFSRATTDQCHAQRFLPTIAYQLTISIPSLKPFILGALDQDPSILSKAFPYQFQQLIVGPLLQLPQQLSSPMIVIVDALDECEDQHLVGTITEQIVQAQVTANFPLRFLFTSRPEPHIGEKFMTDEVASMTHSFALQDFDARDDIRLFLRRRLANVYAARRQIMRAIPQPWPTERDLETLVRRSSGLFIFASTLLKYVGDTSHNPSHRINEIVRVDGPSSPSAYAVLDLLYLQILSHACDIRAIKLTLGYIVCLFNPLPIEQIQILLNADRVDVPLIMEGLNSVLHTPEETEKPVQIFHESFRDFIIHPRRSDAYTINLSECHMAIICSCLDLMTTQLKMNNDVIEDPGLSPSGALHYACKYWAAHLSRVPMNNRLLDLLRKFGVEALIMWIETCRLGNHLHATLRSLRQANGWLWRNALLLEDVRVRAMLSIICSWD